MKRRVQKTPTYKHSPLIAWRRVEEESVLLNVDNSDYYSLDPVATEIWERLGKGQSPAAISRAIAKEYDEAETKVGKDTRQFVDNLLREKLLIPAGPS